MPTLTTKYMGLNLKNPIIVGASNLVKDLDTIRRLEEAGAAAIVYKTLFEEQIELELNLYSVPGDFKKEGRAIVNEQLGVIAEVKKNVKIPVSVKLSPFYTNVLSVIQQMYHAGVDGFVLFNRLFQPDIDINKMEHHFPYNLSHEEDNRLSLRFMGLLFQEIRGSLCANTGILSGGDVVKMILAGADCVQVVSTIYKHGPAQIGKMISEMEEWMDLKKFETIDSFRGKLSRKGLKDPFAYKRSQYIDILMKSEEIFKRYPMR